MTNFNWITVVDLELRELRESVFLMMCLEGITSHKSRQQSQP